MSTEFVFVPEVRRLLAEGKTRQALKKLDAIYAQRNQGELFRTREEIRRHAAAIWLYKVRILEKDGGTREALAWACLECFLNPQNIAAHAVRAELFSKLEDPPLLASVDATAQPQNTESPWFDVAGMDELKLLIEEELILPITQAETYEKYRIRPPNGILLYGPPGCGKTFIARRIADRIGRAFIEIKPGHLGSVYVHGTQEKIQALFDTAGKQAPVIVFFDEIDAMIPLRDAGVGHHYASETNEFLAQLDACHTRNILVIGATNRPDRIDSAALRPGRIERSVFVPPPDRVSREELFGLYLRDRPVAETIDFDKLADETEGFSCADVEHIVNDAARIAARGRERIGMRQLFEAMENRRPSIKPSDLQMFERFRESREN